MTDHPLITTAFDAHSTAGDVVAGLDLRGLRAVVTGASSGLGIPTARALASAGAEVTLAVRDTAAGRAVADDIARTPGVTRPCVRRLDLADQGSIAGFIADWDGALHLLINNAAWSPPASNARPRAGSSSWRPTTSATSPWRSACVRPSPAGPPTATAPGSSRSAPPPTCSHRWTSTTRTSSAAPTTPRSPTPSPRPRTRCSRSRRPAAGRATASSPTPSTPGASRPGCSAASPLLRRRRSTRPRPPVCSPTRRSSRVLRPPSSPPCGPSSRTPEVTTWTTARRRTSSRTTRPSPTTPTASSAGLSTPRPHDALDLVERHDHGDGKVRRVLPSESDSQRAIVQSGYGPVDRVLSVSTTHRVPAPGPRQVQIEVRAASVNPIDWQMIEGNRRLIARRRFPFVPLFDLAGTVVAVGEGVVRLQLGDEVHADNEKAGGGLSERVDVDERLVSLKPAGLDFGEAAALPLAGQTALLATDRGHVTRGSVVVVIGASDGVGHLAVQIALALGAHVIGVASGRNASFVRALGADATIDDTTSELVDVLGAGSVDVVIDCVGGREHWEAARKVLRRGGRFVTISRDYDGPITPRTTAALLAGLLARSVASKHGDRHRYIPVFLRARHELLDRVDALVSAGQLHAHVSRRYSSGIDDVVAALHESAAGRVVGKTVLE